MTSAGSHTSKSPREDDNNAMNVSPIRTFAVPAALPAAVIGSVRSRPEPPLEASRPIEPSSLTFGSGVAAVIGILLLPIGCGLASSVLLAPLGIALIVAGILALLASMACGIAGIVIAAQPEPPTPPPARPVEEIDREARATLRALRPPTTSVRSR